MKLLHSTWFSELLLAGTPQTCLRLGTRSYRVRFGDSFLKLNLFNLKEYIFFALKLCPSCSCGVQIFFNTE